MALKKIVVGISGASGAIYAIDFLKKLRKQTEVEIHGVISQWAFENIRLETNFTPEEVLALFDYTYDEKNLGAAIASGSFKVDAMVIIPCSMKTVASIAYGFSENLIARAADVTIKQQRKLILVPRESPLSAIHLENLLKLAQLGVAIVPPMPAFYLQPTKLEEIIQQQSQRLFDLLDLEVKDAKRWKGEEND